MKGRHPAETGLALFASGDVGRIERWRIARHLPGCAECQAVVDEYAALRSELEPEDAPADASWRKLAAEMKANIRLGLEAGECVSQAVAPRRWLGVRSLAACASLAVLLVTALWLERPVPRITGSESSTDQVLLEATGNGIQVTEGRQTLGLLHGRAQNVDYFASGIAMRARYVDPETGNVTINNVYGQ